MRQREGSHRAGIRGRLRAGALAAGVIASLAGCAGIIPDGPRAVGPAVEAGSGPSGTGQWTAWIYPTEGGGSCIEVRGIPGAGTSCLSEGATALSQGRTGDEVLLTAGTTRPGVAAMRLRHADGSVEALPLLAGAGIPGRYAFVALPAKPLPVAIDLLAATGEVIEELPVDPELALPGD